MYLSQTYVDIEVSFYIKITIIKVYWSNVGELLLIGTFVFMYQKILTTLTSRKIFPHDRKVNEMQKQSSVSLHGFFGQKMTPVKLASHMISQNFVMTSGFYLFNHVSLTYRFPCRGSR